MTILKAQNLTKSYKSKIAVDNLSITIQKGDIFGLIGQNGAGKSTFMRLITSLSQPDSGTIELFGETKPNKLTAARARIGAIIESPALFSNLTAADNLEYYRLQRGIVERERVNEVLNLVGLTHTGKKKFKEFSLGMKQRLGLAVAMLSHPDFLIFDEPTNGLDPTGIIEMRDIIKRLNQNGITILISSHILAELAQVANKYAIIHHGKLLKNLTQSQLNQECKRALAVTIDNIPNAITVLDKLGIRDYKQVSSTQIRVYDYLDNPTELNFMLNQEGVRVASITEVGDNLEDYYAKIIGGAGK